jgi:enoyl-CoA hydratase
MSYKYILYEKEGNIARITLNKPDVLNAMTFIGHKSQTEDTNEVWAAYDEAAEDDDVKVVIIKGAGRAFCVGHDLTKVGFVYGFGTQTQDRKPSQRIRLDYDRRTHDTGVKLLHHPKITIAQTHGYVSGSGATMFMLASDIAITSDDAQIGFTEQRLGFAGSGTLTAILIYHVGLKRALDLILSGRLISGEEAAKIGMATKSVPADKLEDETEKVAQAMALLPRDGIAIGKATRHLVYDRLGLTGDFIQAYISHTMFTNLRWEPDEYNFFKERRDKGAKAGFHGRDERYKGLI